MVIGTEGSIFIALQDRSQNQMTGTGKHTFSSKHEEELPQRSMTLLPSLLSASFLRLVQFDFVTV
jgi:hypothetical protein